MPGRYALIVASGAYSDPKLSRLRTPTTDAEELARVLRDPEIGDFEVELAVDEQEAALRRRIAAFFSERSRDDLLLLHFSCHGLKDDSGHLYFAATDTEVDQLDATAVSAEFVSRQMTRSRSRKVIALLDCCYSGAIARGLTFRGGDRVDLDDHLGGNGRVILTASSAMEYAFEGEELTGEGNPSVFTTAVVKALETGEADRDQDHRISVEELYDYVCEQVREVTPDQTPNMLSHLEGELFVARSSYVVPVPVAELSPELRSAIDSPLAGVREGAVTELARLLAGHDRALAEGARAALTRLSEDDSRRVAGAATAALGEDEAEPEVGRGRFRRAGPVVAGPAPVAPPPRPVVATARDEPASEPARWGPFALTLAGALLVFAGVAAGAGESWAEPMQLTTILTVLAVIAAVVLSRLRRSWTAASEPVLAGFPLGLATAAGGLSDLSGPGSTLPLLLGAALMLASVLWRRPEGTRPGWTHVGVTVAGALGVFVAPSLTWWGSQSAGALLAWPLPVGLLLAVIAAVAGVAVGRWRGGGMWAALVAAAGGMAFIAALGLAEYATTSSGADSATGGGPWLALISGVVVAGAGFYALLRPDPPPAQR